MLRDDPPNKPYRVIEGAKAAGPKGKPGPRFATKRTSAIMGTDFPAIRWVVPGYLPEGLSILAGRQKLGKSQLCLNWAIAVASGGRAMGSIECESGDVLYIDLENGERRLQRRILSLYPDAETQPDLDRIEWTTESPAIGKGFREALDEWRRSVPKPRLVVVDVLQRIKPPGRASGNAYENDYEAIAPLQQWATTHGIAVILITHTRKGGAEDKLESVMGSNGLSACADTTIVLDTGDMGRTLYVRGRDVEEKETALRFDDGRWEILGDAIEVKRSDERRQVLDCLLTAAAPMGPTAIAAEVGAKVENIKVLLGKMVRDGEVYRDPKKGAYIHPERRDLYPATPGYPGYPVTSGGAGHA